MKRKRNSLTGQIAHSLAGLLLLLATGCTSEEAESPQTGELVPLTIAALYTTDGGEATPTRAPNTPALSPGTHIGFFVKEDADRGYLPCYNAEGAYDNSLQSWLPTTPIWLNNNDASVAIYAPYDKDQAQGSTTGTLSLTAIRRTDGTKDIWSKTFTVNSNSPKNQEQILTHVYSRMQVTVIKDATYTATASLSALNLTGTEVYATANYDPFDTDAHYRYSSTKGVTATSDPALTVGTLPAASDAAKIDLLLIPATLTSNLILTLTIDGKPMPAPLDKAKFSGELQPGKQYNAIIKLIAGKLEVLSVAVAKWDNSLPPIDAGEGEFEDETGRIGSVDINDKTADDSPIDCSKEM